MGDGKEKKSMTEREIARRKAAARKARKERERKARNRRVVLTVCLMLAVCVGSIGGTIAWLQDKTESVVNTFSPSNINIELTEEGAGEDGKKSYDMVPGVVLDKKPLVTVKAGSEDCWVFVEVTEKCEVESYRFSDFITYGVNPNNWQKLNEKSNVYYCEATDITADRSISVIGYQNGDEFVKDKVLVNTSVTKEMMDALETAGADKYPTLSFKAYAIQKSSFDTAADAWAELNPTPTDGN